MCHIFSLSEIYKKYSPVEVGVYNPGFAPWVLQALDPSFWPHCFATNLWPTTVSMKTSWFLCHMMIPMSKLSTPWFF